MLIITIFYFFRFDGVIIITYSGKKYNNDFNCLCVYRAVEAVKRVRMAVVQLELHHPQPAAEDQGQALQVQPAHVPHAASCCVHVENLLPLQVYSIIRDWHRQSHLWCILLIHPIQMLHHILPTNSHISLQLQQQPLNTPHFTLSP